MNQAIVVFTLSVVLSSSLLEITEAQSRTEQDGWILIQAIETLSKVVENLQLQIEMQASVLNNLVTKEELSSTCFDQVLQSQTSECNRPILRNLETKAEMHENSLNNLVAEMAELRTLMTNLNAKEERHILLLSNLEAQTNIHTTLLNKVESNLENQSVLLTTLLTNEETQANNLTNPEANVLVDGDELKTFNEDTKNLSSASKGGIEGIIAGTTLGVVVIPFDSREPKTISRQMTQGVAFNWETQKIYWIEKQVGIKTANLDGSSVELLRADTSSIFGLAVDQITGNLYYGVQKPHPRVRVCDRNGNKCVTIIRLGSLGYEVEEGVIDIALYPSEGLMFWSALDMRNSLDRANMDGTNSSMLVRDEISGISIDDVSRSVYWANEEGLFIGTCDFNGKNESNLLNTKIRAHDVVVDGDTFYFGGWGHHAVYSLTQDGIESLVANTTGGVYHIASYGRDKVPSRPNPCKSSPCTNLCVLSRDSYTCL